MKFSRLSFISNVGLNINYYFKNECEVIIEIDKTYNIRKKGSKYPDKIINNQKQLNNFVSNIILLYLDWNSVDNIKEHV